MFVDFAMLPPEINSARMYGGPGSGPMLAAASAWNGLAAELRSTALCYGSVLSALTGEEWHGPASAAMSAAVAPYVAWMSTTAAQAEQTAAQAESAVAAYEAAFAATVPPPLIAANRAQLAALVATNVLGQNTPAIAATEAQYGEMWAQDAAAMYGYAGERGRAGPASRGGHRGYRHLGRKSAGDVVAAEHRRASRAAEPLCANGIHVVDLFDLGPVVDPRPEQQLLEHDLVDRCV
jgi:hypothetical protein